jgi:hypothetical protein
MTLTGVTATAYCVVDGMEGAAVVYARQLDQGRLSRQLGRYFRRGDDVRPRAADDPRRLYQAISTWTQDSKQTVDEYIAFITSRGQVIVYQGTDPATANTFALVGLYDLGAPIGRRCFLRISGNLWIICVDGILPMSEMLTQDRAAAAKVAPTTMIQNAMMNARGSTAEFRLAVHRIRQGATGDPQHPAGGEPDRVQYVMNTLTGRMVPVHGAQCQLLGSPQRRSVFRGQ